MTEFTHWPTHNELDKQGDYRTVYFRENPDLLLADIDGLCKDLETDGIEVYEQEHPTGIYYMADCPIEMLEDFKLHLEIYGFWDFMVPVRRVRLDSLPGFRPDIEYGLEL